jgi:hypothetical protein
VHARERPLHPRFVSKPSTDAAVSIPCRGTSTAYRLQPTAEDTPKPIPNRPRLRPRLRLPATPQIRAPRTTSRRLTARSGPGSAKSCDIADEPGGRAEVGRSSHGGRRGEQLAVPDFYTHHDRAAPRALHDPALVSRCLREGEDHPLPLLGLPPLRQVPQVDLQEGADGAFLFLVFLKLLLFGYFWFLFWGVA